MKRVTSLLVGVALALLATTGLAFAAESHAALAHILPSLDGQSLALASLAFGGVLQNATIRSLMGKKADIVGKMRTLSDAAAAENRDFTEAEATQFAGYQAEVARFNAAIQREETILAEEMAAPARPVAASPAPLANISVEDNRLQDRRRGFATGAEFLSAIVKAGRGFGIDERLTIGAAAPTTFGNEAAGADGGFAIPPQFSEEIWKLSLGEQSLLPKTANTEVSGNSMIFPKDETTPWGGTGVQVQWQAEAVAGSQSKVLLGSEALVLHKLMALLPMSNELVSDGFAVTSYAMPLIADRINWKVNEAILFGTGVGQPLGCLTNAGNTGAAAIVVAKESGQATQTLDPKNISKMVSRLLVGELDTAFWLATPDILQPLESMTAGQYPIYLPNQSMQGAPYGTLRGRPLMLSEHAAAFSSQSDISLISLRGYRTITKAGGMQTDTSMHIYFDADAMALRVTFRMNGKPIMSAPVTPPKSSNTRSHFVTLQAR